MKLNKNELAHALTALGKLICRTSENELYKAVHIRRKDNKAVFTVQSQTESLSVEIPAETESDAPIDRLVYYADLKDAVKGTAAGTARFLDNAVQVESGRKIFTRALPEVPCKWSDNIHVPDDAQKLPLPDGIVSMLNTAASVVNRMEPRLPLRGMNVSSDGITATNGKELLNIPLGITLESFTIPFPLALMATKEMQGGTLKVWKQKENTWFQFAVGAWSWTGKALAGNYPDWRNIVPNPKHSKYKVAFSAETAATLLAFVHKTTGEHFRLECISEHSLQVSLASDEKQHIAVECVISNNGKNQPIVLARPVLLNLLATGQTSLHVFNERAPILATGGTGR